jgi:hypothetical protein
MLCHYSSLARACDHPCLRSLAIPLGIIGGGCWAAHLLAWAWERQDLQLLVDYSTKLYLSPWKALPIAKMHPAIPCGWSQRGRAARSLLRRRRSGCPSNRGRPELLASPTNAALISRHKGTAAGRQTTYQAVALGRNPAYGHRKRLGIV